MTDIQQRIADILNTHVCMDYGRCGCGLGTDYEWEPWVTHVVEVIITELGLTQEWGIWIAATDNVPEFWEPLDHEPSAEIRKLAKTYPGRAIGHRWLTGWEPEP